MNHAQNKGDVKQVSRSESRRSNSSVNFSINQSELPSNVISQSKTKSSNFKETSLNQVQNNSLKDDNDDISQNDSSPSVDSVNLFITP